MISERLFIPEPPIFFRECQKNKNSHTLVIAYTSHGGTGKFFELYKVLDQYNKTHQLFLSSRSDPYYITNIGRNYSFKNVIEIIFDIVKIYDIKKVITLGNSAGATGGILYGFELAKSINTSIIACAPSPGPALKIINSLLDLPRPIAHECNFKLYIDKKFKPDVDSNLKLMDKFQTINVPAHHNVLKHLYITGQLFKILDSELYESDFIHVDYENFTPAIWYLNL